jgi:fluoride exporter
VTDVLLVCLGAAVGAPLRYLADRFVQARHDTVMPWGTLTVNVAGSLVLGVLTGLAVQHQLAPEVLLAAGTGFCGALTTYSSFSYETLRLLEDGAWLYAALNTVVSLAAGLGAAVVGYTIGAA